MDRRASSILVGGPASFIGTFMANGQVWFGAPPR
jgi:hypothetical protein